MKKLGLALVGGLAMWGCGGGGGGGNGSSPQTRVAFVNAAADSGTLDFALNRSVTASGQAFASAPTFKTVDAGDYDVAIRAAGGIEDLVNEAHTFAAGTDNLVVAAGLITPPNDSGTPPEPQQAKSLQMFTGTIDRTTTALSASRARIVVLNAFLPAAEAPFPSVDFRNSTDPINTSVSVQNLAFGSFRSIDVPSGTLAYEVRQTGSGPTYISSTPLTLNAGKIYLVIITGTEGGTGTQLPTIQAVPIAPRS